MDLTGKPFEASDQKKSENRFSTLQKKNSWTQGFWKQHITFHLQTRRSKLNKTLKEGKSDRNRWNFAKP